MESLIFKICKWISENTTLIWNSKWNILLLQSISAFRFGNIDGSIWDSQILKVKQLGNTRFIPSNGLAKSKYGISIWCSENTLASAKSVEKWKIRNLRFGAKNGIQEISGKEVQISSPVKVYCSQSLDSMFNILRMLYLIGVISFSCWMKEHLS